MRIQIKVLLEDDKIPAADRQSVVVETHDRRGDVFVVAKAYDVIEGASEAIYDVALGGRLVITTPNIERELVVDKDQNAVVRKANQENTEGRADRPDPKLQPEPARSTTPPPNAPPPQPSNPQPRVQTNQAPPQPGATRTTPPPATPAKPTTTPPMEPKKSTDGTLDTRDAK